MRKLWLIVLFTFALMASGTLGHWVAQVWAPRAESNCHSSTFERKRGTLDLPSGQQMDIRCKQDAFGRPRCEPD